MSTTHRPGHEVTVVNPHRSQRAESFAKSGGSFVQKRVEELPETATWDLIREDFPIPLDKMWLLIFQKSAN